jgi:hypothetical protein
MAALDKADVSKSFKQVWRSLAWSVLAYQGE